MYELKKNGKVFRSKSVGTGPSSYEKRIYRAAVSQSLRNNAIDDNMRNTNLMYVCANKVGLKDTRELSILLCTG